jgi:pilus assembly protein Flp/PilA
MTAQFVRDDQGATAIEYGLIAALIAVVLIGSLTALGQAMAGPPMVMAFPYIAAMIQSAGS